MNKHIELVKKWLADKDSVSKEELIENADAANAADAAYAANANYANYANYAAANAAANASYDAAEYWVSQYEGLTK